MKAEDLVTDETIILIDHNISTLVEMGKVNAGMPAGFRSKQCIAINKAIQKMILQAMNIGKSAATPDQKIKLMTLIEDHNIRELIVEDDKHHTLYDCRTYPEAGFKFILVIKDMLGKPKFVYHGNTPTDLTEILLS